VSTEASPRFIAGRLIDALEADLPATDKRRWKVEDHEGLSNVVLLDRVAESGRYLDRVADFRHHYLLGNLATFRSALPFAEVERWAAGNAYDELKYPTGLRDDIARHIPRQEICVEGIARTISGRELTDRWWDWRRGIGDYEGGAGLDKAREAIASVYDHLAS
jgi:hypothetical protein